MSTNIIVRYAEQEINAGFWEVRAISQDGEVMAHVKIRRLYECATIGTIFHLVTREQYRRQGIAEAILKRAEQLAYTNDIRMLLCTIRKDNPASIALFRKIGFDPTNEWRSPRTDADIAMYTKTIRKETNA